MRYKRYELTDLNNMMLGQTNSPTQAPNVRGAHRAVSQLRIWIKITGPT